jgi:uncharacterized membrane protein YgcG
MRAAALLLLLLAGAAAGAAAQERSLTIQAFDATIAVERDGAIRVTETITVRFSGSWNGLYRSIPVKYRTARGLNWTLGVDVLGATLRDGRALRVETGRDRHYLKVKMWVPGAQDATHTIVLRYRATNGLRFFEEHDELYWNVTGDEWDVPVGMATARVELPPGVAGVRATAFTGLYGSTAQEARVETADGTVRFATRRPLGFREGLTVVVGWDKGAVTEPSAAAKAAGVVASNWPLAIPIPVFLLAFAAWRRRGRDPERRPVTVRYEPPERLTPGEAGTLIDNEVDLRDLTATLVDLAVRGYLRFEETDERKFLGLFGSRGYTLHRLEPPAGTPPLAPHEQRVLAAVFDARGPAVKLSQLEDEFYASIPGIKDAVHERLVQKGYYHARPDKVRAHWIVGAAFAGIVIAGAGGALAAKLLLTPVPFVVAGIASAIILGGFGLVMPARTVAGARTLEGVLGFEEFLTRVESEAYKRVIVGHPEMFDKYLPYAMAFGVEKKWAAAFEGIYTQPPNWYVGPSFTHFSVGQLSSSLSGFTREAGSTLTSSPRSSSGSGFGGGGSSGGGGGGGGGGGF